MDGNKFETILLNAKEEIDELDSRIKAVKTSTDELKDTVIKYNELKHQEKDLKKLRHLKFREFEIKKTFFEQATGSFPDGMFPLFNQNNS